jgi:hypothetical protein
MKKQSFILILAGFVTLMSSSNISAQNCGFSSTSELERQDIPITNILYNIHFVGPAGQNFTPDGANGTKNGLNFAYFLIDAANQVLADFNSSPLTSQEFEFLGDSRFRWKKYTDPNNVNDTYDGIWFWETQPSTFPYNGNVINIIFKDFNVDPRKVRGFAGLANAEIYLQDAIYHDFDWWDFQRIINHELGHLSCLSAHSFSQGNPCEGKGIDWQEEENNRETSKNLMGYNANQNAITKCQMDMVWDCLKGSGRTSRPWVEISCEPLSSQVIIETETYVHWDYERHLNEDVIIEPLATLEITCDVYTNSKFIVQRGGKLIVNGCKITSLCEEKWPGIEVWGNPAKLHSNVDINNLQADDPGVADLKFCTIENAYIGAKANPTSIQNYQTQVAHWGGIIMANQVDFLNVWKAAEFMRYPPKNKSYFVDCYIEGTDGKAGITMWGTNGIQIKHCTFEKMHTTLDDYGVVSADASYSIVDGSTFTDLENAIHILNSVATPYDIQIDGTDLPNEISGSTFGIYADFCSSLNIKSNSIHDNTYAFRTNNRSGYTVYGNYFYNNEYYHIFSDASQNIRKDIYANTFHEGGHGIYLRFRSQDFTMNFNCFEELGNKNDIFHQKANKPVLNNLGAPGFPAFNFFHQPTGVSNDVVTWNYTNQHAQEFLYHYPDPVFHVGINPRLIPRCDYEGENCTTGGLNQKYDADDERLIFGQLPNQQTICGNILTESFDPESEPFSYTLFNNLNDSIYKYKANYANDTSDHTSEHLSTYYELQRKRMGHRLMMQYFTQESPDSLRIVLDSITDFYQWDVIWSYYNNKGMDSLANSILNGVSFAGEYVHMDFIHDIYSQITRPQDTILHVDSADMANLYALASLDSLYASSAARALLFVLEDTLFIPGTPTVPAGKEINKPEMENTLLAKVGFEAYPNPNNGLVNLRIKPEYFDRRNTYTAKLLDLSGKTVATTDFSSNHIIWDLNSTVSQSHKGLYFVQITSDQEELGTVKLILIY